MFVKSFAIFCDTHRRGGDHTMAPISNRRRSLDAVRGLIMAGVLQRIAVVYACAAVVTLHTRQSGQLGVALWLDRRRVLIKL